jgi:hypothetical protein
MGARLTPLAFVRRVILLALTSGSFAAVSAHATDEIQVYNASIAPMHTFTLQQHLNYIGRGSTTPDFENGFASHRSLNGTPELAYGVTDWYEIGLYAPFAVEANGTFLPGGVKLRHLFVSPHADERKFFYGLNIELSYQTPRFSPNPFAVEFRPIIGIRDLGWEFIVNPIIDLEFGPEPNSGFAPAVRLARSIAKDVMVGVEYYADFGPIGRFSTSENQKHTVFGVVDFSLFGLDVNLGMGFGLTAASDTFVTKLIVGRAF